MPVSVPYPDRSRPYAGLAAVEREVEDELYRSGLFGLGNMFRQALEAGALEGAEMVRDFALALDQVTRSSRNQLANTHHELGALMQEAVVSAYARARTRLGRHVGPYRLATRDAGGKLIRALSDPAFFRGTYDGIAFGNIVLMDGAARQWHRLNFGALPEAGPRARHFAIRWQGLVVASLGYDQAPSAPFLLPKGFWSPRTGLGAFGPTSARALYKTKGIEAWNFLDAGPELLGREVGPAYERLYRRWFDSAQRSLGPLSRVKTVHGSIAVPR